MVGRVTSDKVTLVRKDGKTYYVFPDAAEIYQDAWMNWGGWGGPGWIGWY